MDSFFITAESFQRPEVQMYNTSNMNMQNYKCHLYAISYCETPVTTFSMFKCVKMILENSNIFAVRLI